MTSQAPWTDLTDQEHSETWDRFDKKFAFRAARGPNTGQQYKSRASLSPLT